MEKMKILHPPSLIPNRTSSPFTREHSLNIKCHLILHLTDKTLTNVLCIHEQN